MTVQLPDVGDGSRRARRAEERRRRRVQRAVVGVVLAAFTIVGGLAVTREGERPRLAAPSSGATADASSGDEPLLPAARPGAVLVTDAAGELRSVVVLVVGPSGRGGDLVHVPVNLLLGSVAFGERAVRELEAVGGATVVGEALGGLLRADVTVVELGPGLAPAGLGAAAGDPLAAITADQAVWDRWLAAIAAGSDREPSPAVLGELGDELLALARGTVVHHVVPVTTSGDGLARVRQADLDGLLAHVIPGAAGTR